MNIGLYIHIPFCVSKCYYCDFLSFAKSEDKEAYINTLVKEIESYGKMLGEDYTVTSLFIGGGTPTTLPPFLLDKILSALTKNFELAKEAEWTIEANPGTITKDTIQVINTYPVNRISLGLQSTHNRLLKLIGRGHTFAEWEKSYALLKEHTVCDLSADLMFALPTQTFQEFQETLRHISHYALDHLSLYALIVEEGTKFWKAYEAGKLAVCDEITDRKMYHYAKDFLKSEGYEQYEISNWAKPQKACRHNSLYWKRGEYIGMGLGAHSFFKEKRFSNEEKIESYIQSQGNPSAHRQEEVITKEMAMQEFMFLGLRMTKGISIKTFYDTFNRHLFEVYKDPLDKWIKHQILVKDKDSLFLSDYGLDVCNEVFSSFL